MHVPAPQSIIAKIAEIHGKMTDVTYGGAGSRRALPAFVIGGGLVAVEGLPG